MGEIIRKLESQGLDLITDEELEYIPLSWLQHSSNRIALEFNWKRLPSHYQEVLQKKRPCYEHYNNGSDHIDGPAPSIENCYECKHRYGCE